MPLYFFLSGLFFKLYDGFGSFFVKKVNKLLIPFFFFYLLTSVVLPNILHSFFGYHFETVIGWPSLYAFVYPEVFPNIPIWFLWCLFISNIIFYLLVLVSRRREKLLVLLAFLFSLAGYILHHYEINLPAFTDSSLWFFPYFFFGYYTTQRGFLQSKLSWITLCWALPALLVVSFVLSNMESDIMLVQMLRCWIASMAGIFFVLLLSRLLGRIPLITYFGRYSIMILVSHLIVIQVTHKVFNGIIPDGLPINLLSFLVTVLLSLLLIPLMKRYIPWFVAQKDLFPSTRATG